MLLLPEGIIVELDREYLLEQADACLKEAKKFRRDFERDKRRGYTSLYNYYTIMAKDFSAAGYGSL
jgi:hypothetical protein